MASTWDEVVAKLGRSHEYRSDFDRVFRGSITPDNIRDAIAEFERSLTTPNSRFDQFLKGDKTALSPDEKEGYRIFRAVGCTSCHQGMNMGGNLYQKFGVMGLFCRSRKHHESGPGTF